MSWRNLSVMYVKDHSQIMSRKKRCLIVLFTKNATKIIKSRIDIYLKLPISNATGLGMWYVRIVKFFMMILCILETVVRSNKIVIF